jgi:uncharacterized protein YidB (DUF937 family)
MAALLGLLAVAGYQNRDKIGELLGGLGGGNANDPRNANDAQSDGTRAGGTGQGGLGGLLGSLGGLFGGGGAGGSLSGGLGDIVDSFRQNGQSETADSWVGPGANRDVAPNDVERAIGPEVLDGLVQSTGLSRDELLRRLSSVLPEAVNKLTPQGRLPASDDEVTRIF